MTQHVEQLQAIVKPYEINATSDDEGNLIMKCHLNGSPVPVVVYFEKANFQIDIGGLVDLDKVEGDSSTSVADIEPLLSDFVESLTQDKVVVLQYSLLGIIIERSLS